MRAELVGNQGARGERDGHHEDARHEDEGGDDRQAVEVLLENARARAGVVHGGGDHVRDARALAGVHEDENDRQDAGQEEKRFWDFSSGIYRTRGIDFYTTVNVWMCDLNEDLFSTMTHNKYYLYFLKQGRNGDHFFLSSRESGDRAWKTEEELQAWIRTYRGIVSCFKGKQAVVWTYRERYHFVSPEQYENLEAQEDVMRMNGLRYCKRIYDDKNYTLHTYFVWYWDDPAISKFAEAAAKQNKIRKKYEINLWTDYRIKENACALRELREGIAEAVDLQPLYRQ